MKKIVIVGPAYPYRGGQAFVEASLFQTLKNLDYDCSTISFSVLYPSVFFPGKTQFEESSFVAYPHSERIFRIINSVNPFTWIKAALKIKKLKPEAVIFVWWMPFFGPAYFVISRLARWFLKTKIVFLMENFISHENRWFDKVSTNITLKIADAFICQSGYVKKNVEQSFKNKLIFETTLCLFDCFDFKKYNNDSAKRYLGITTQKAVMFFGLIRPYKGLDQLIRAFPIILKNHSGTTLLIVGENYESEEKYQQIINQQKISDHVIMVNKYIPNEEMEVYFKAADVICLPYYSATQSGIAMLSYGFRKPLVVTDVGGLREIVKENETGKIISDNDPEKIASAVHKILTNENGIDYALNIENFVHEIGYKNMKAMFEKILDATP